MSPVPVSKGKALGNSEESQNFSSDEVINDFEHIFSSDEVIRAFE